MPIYLSKKEKKKIDRGRQGKILNRGERGVFTGEISWA